MAPAILTNMTSGQPFIVAGAAGGSRIPTSVFMNLVNLLYFGKNLAESVDGPRIHHQLEPMYVEYNSGFPDKILKILREKGHQVQEMEWTTSSAPMIFYNQETELIEAKGDSRRVDCMPSGF